VIFLLLLVPFPYVSLANYSLSFFDVDVILLIAVLWILI
jgi:hypothetical protein